MSDLASPSLKLARELRKAITERDDTLKSALTRYDHATTEAERYHAAADLMIAIPKADGRYEAIRDNAVRRCMETDERETSG